MNAITNSPIAISRFGASHGCDRGVRPGCRLGASPGSTFDLSVQNPNGGEQVVHRGPQEIMDEIAALDIIGRFALAVWALAPVPSPQEPWLAPKRLIKRAVDIEELTTIRGLL